MKKILVFVLIICMAFIIAGAQEEVVTKDRTATKPIEESIIPQANPVTYLKVTLLDGVNDKVFELKNCIIQIKGELNMIDNVFPYTKTFINGNDYEITVWVKPKN